MNFQNIRPILTSKELLDKVLGKAREKIAQKSFPRAKKLAMTKAKEHMEEVRRERMELLSAPLRDGLKKLQRWKNDKAQSLEARQQNFQGMGTLRKDIRRGLDDERARAAQVYEERKEWIEKGMKTVPEPYLRVAAVLIHQEA